MDPILFAYAAGATAVLLVFLLIFSSFINSSQYDSSDVRRTPYCIISWILTVYSYSARSYVYIYAIWWLVHIDAHAVVPVIPMEMS